MYKENEVIYIEQEIKEEMNEIFYNQQQDNSDENNPDQETYFENQNEQCENVEEEGKYCLLFFLI